MKLKLLVFVAIYLLPTLLVIGCIEKEVPVKVESPPEQKYTKTLPTTVTPTVLNLKVGETAKMVTMA